MNGEWNVFVVPFGIKKVEKEFYTDISIFFYMYVYPFIHYSLGIIFSVYQFISVVIHVFT